MKPATSNAAATKVHTYTLTRWDLQRTAAHALSRNRVLLAFFIIISTLIAVVELRTPEMAARSLTFKIFFIIVFDAVFVTFNSALTLVVLGLMILIRRHHGVLGAHTLEVTPSGLIERTEFNETLHRWQGFHRVVRTRSYLYLWVTDSMMHTVPVRSFESEEAARASSMRLRHTEKLRRRR